MRVKDDPVLLAAVLAAIGVVFMTASFFIVGEYNTAYAIGIVVAVRLVTAKEELNVADGAFLVAVGLLAVRTYEVMIYLGPLLALMIAWTVYRIRPRPVVATFLYLAAILPFLGGACGGRGFADPPFFRRTISAGLRRRAGRLAERPVRPGDGRGTGDLRLGALASAGSRRPQAVHPGRHLPDPCLHCLRCWC